MRLLKQGLMLGEIPFYLQYEEEEGYDITDFVQTFMENGLVAEVGGLIVGAEKNMTRDGAEKRTL